MHFSGVGWCAGSGHFAQLLPQDRAFEHTAHRLARGFDGADLRETDIAGLKVLDAKLFKNALISPRQAADLLTAWELIVA